MPSAVVCISKKHHAANLALKALLPSLRGKEGTPREGKGKETLLPGGEKEGPAAREDESSRDTATRGKGEAKGAARLFLPLISLFLISAATAADLNREVKFDIPAQPLSQALADFSRQADTIVVASSELTNGKTSKPVNETTTAAKALKTLLNGTKLQYKQEDDGTIIVTQPIAKAGNDAATVLRVAQNDNPSPGTGCLLITSPSITLASWR